MKKIIAIFAILVVLSLTRASAQTQLNCSGTSCSFTIQCVDDYGDGWEGSVSVYQGQELRGTVSLPDGFYGEYEIAVCDGDSVRIEWNGSNMYNENSIAVLNGDGSVVLPTMAIHQGSYSGSMTYNVVTFMPVCPSCIKPNALTASSITSSSAVLGWTEIGDASTWYYTYGIYNTPTDTWQMVTVDSVELTDLQANTLYYFFVYSDCGGGDTSAVSVVSFRTDCGLMSLPIVEDFESRNDIPFCWSVLESVSQDFGYGSPQIYPEVDSYYGINGSNGLLLVNNDGTGPAPTSVMSPKIPVDANEVEVLLWVKGEDEVQVGYVTTNDSATAVFHLVGTAGPTAFDDNNWDYAWEQFTVSFDTVSTADSIWVVFRRAPSLEMSSMYVDNVTIRQIINCPLPTGLSEVVGMPTSGQVTLSWTDTVGTQWQIASGPQGFNPDTATALVSAASTIATVTGLNDSMVYDFYVRTVCDNVNGYWVGPVSIMPNVYKLDTIHTVDTIISCGVNVVSDGGFAATCTPGMKQTVVLLPAGTGNTVRIRGYAHFNSWSSYYSNKMRIFAGSDTNGMLLANINSVNTDNIDITSEVGAITIWYSVASDDYYAAEGFKFYVSCEEVPDCTTPYGLTATEVGGNYADVVWNYNAALGEAAGFTLIVTNLGDSTSFNIPVGGDVRSYAITGLNERTAYNVKLALDCPNVDTVEITFTTGCIVGGDLRVGTGTSTTSYLPTYTYYNYSLTQQIFTAAELESIDTILGFKFYMSSSGETPDRMWDVYFDTTSLSHYSSTNDYQPTSNSSRYFHGMVSFAQGWNEVILDSAFALPVGKNITLTINDITGSYPGSRSFRKTNTSDTMSLYSYTDNGSYNPTTQTGMANSGKFRTTITFVSNCFATDCVPPTHIVATPDTHSVHLTWLAGADETSWKVEYRNSDSVTWTVADAAVSTQDYTVTGLMPATDYVFRVSTVCADTTLGRTVTATTHCGEYALPFATNFEWFTATNTAPETERCWYRAAESVYGDYYYPYCQNASSYENNAHSGTWCIYFAGYRDRLVLPRMSVSVSALSMDFYAMYRSYDYYGVPAFEVGVALDPDDTNTYTVVQTVTPGANAYELFTVDFDSYTGPDGYIFFRSASGNDNSIYLDDITVTLLPACRSLMAVNVQNMTSTTAELAILDSHSRTNYTVFWSTTNNIQNAIDSLTVNVANATLTGLVPSTTYYAWVRANCGGSDGQSRYKAVRPFTTLCSAIAVADDAPWFTEFEADSMQCMWQLSNAPGVEWKLSVSNTSGVHAFSGNNMVNLGSSQTAEAMLVLPTFDFTGMTGNAELSLYHYMYSQHVAYSQCNAATLSVYYRTDINGPWNLITTIDTVVVNTWKKRYIELPISQGVANYQVAIVGNPNGNNYGLYLDNLEVKGVTTCLPPTDVTVRDITERAATIAWTGSASAYKVQYRPVGQWSWNARIVENNDTVVLIPLDMLADYEVRVASLCSTYEQSEYGDVVRFMTDICTDRVEKVNYADLEPDSVTRMAPFNSDKYNVYNEILVDGSRLAGMTDIGGLAFYVDAIVGQTDITGCQIYIGHTTAAALTGFLFDTSFVQVFDGEFPLRAGWNSLMFDVPFAWNGTDNVVIGFKSHSQNDGDTVVFGAHKTSGNKAYCGSSSVPFDPSMANMLSASSKVASDVVPDLKLYSCNPVCNEPVLSRVSTTATTIDIEWYNEGAAIELQFKESSATTWDASVMVSGTNRYLLEDMASITGYDIRLRRVCDAESMFCSDWVNVSVVTDTMCSVPTGLMVVAVDAHAASFSWTDGPVVGSLWQLHVWNDEIDIYRDVTTNPATVDGLVSGGTYHAAVRAYCGAGNHVAGDFSEPVVFNNICQPVSNLEVTLVNGTDVHLTWTAGERNTQWYVCYGFLGFDINQQLGYMVVNSPSATITGLGALTAPYSGAKDAEGTTYAFRVRAICADGWNSNWSGETTARFVGIDEVEDAEMHFDLQPNPTSDHVFLRIDGFDGSARVDILGIDGRRMFDFDVQSPRLDLDVSTWASGTYFVRVQTGKWTAVRKLVVK